jgi:hypothetical protein
VVPVCWYRFLVGFSLGSLLVRLAAAFGKSGKPYLAPFHFKYKKTQRWKRNHKKSVSIR